MMTTARKTLVFTPVDGVPNTSVTTGFTLSDLSSGFGRPTLSTTTTVINRYSSVATTTTGTYALSLHDALPIFHPFSGVTVSDSNNGGADTNTLTITLSGSGTLSG